MQAAEDDKEEVPTQHGGAVNHGKGAGAALEDSPSKQEARVSTPLKRKRAADGAKVQLTSSCNQQLLACTTSKCKSWCNDGTGQPHCCI